MFILFISAPAAYFLLLVGTAQSVEKYGQTFSALQFLLSPDRTHYVSGIELYVRFIIIHYASIAALYLAQLPFWHIYLGYDNREKGWHLESARLRYKSDDQSPE